MLETRIILVDGAPGRAGVRLAQALALQLEAHGAAPHLPMRNEPGHPLRRAYAPEGYASVDAFGDALVLQWQNFAIRASTEADAWLCAGTWLEGPRALVTAGALDSAGAIDLALRLFAALEPLSPALIYVSDADHEDDAAAIGNGAFARLESHRTLLNAARLDADALLAEALAFLAVPARPIALEADLARRLAGRYGHGTTTDLELLATSGAGLTLRGLPAGLGTAPRPLLPATDGRFLVAGLDLELRADLDAAGRPTGLLARTSEPALLDLPPFLARSVD